MISFNSLSIFKTVYFKSLFSMFNARPSWMDDVFFLRLGHTSVWVCVCVCACALCSFLLRTRHFEYGILVTLKSDSFSSPGIIIVSSWGIQLYICLITFPNDFCKGSISCLWGHRSICSVVSWWASNLTEFPWVPRSNTYLSAFLSFFCRCCLWSK